MTVWRSARPAALVVGVAVVLGMAIRLGLLLSPRALWSDEVAVAENILHRSFGGLFERLDNNQHAPFGFLIATKAAVSMLGPTEAAFRAYSFVLGVVFPALLWLWARRFLSQSVAAALAVVAALSPTLIGYSVELKPYAGDAVATLILLWIYVPTGLQTLDATGWRREFASGCVSAVLLMFSFPAVFCVSALTAIRGSQAIWRRSPRDVSAIAVGAVPWLATFAAYSFYLLGSTSKDGYLQEFWSNAFFQWPTSPDAIRADIALLLEAFGPNVGFEPALAILFLIAGTAYAWRRCRPLWISLIAVVGMAVAASLMHRWPFSVRLLLFLAPVALIFVGMALELFVQGRTAKVVVITTAALMYVPLLATNDLVDSIGVRTGLLEPASAWMELARPGDVVYAYYLADAELRFYQDRGRLPNLPVVSGVSLALRPWSEARHQLDQLPSTARVWAVFNNVRDVAFDERQAILQHLGSKRVELRRVSEHLSLFGPVSEPVQ